MDLVTKQKETRLSSSSQGILVKVPYEMSREKALRYVENRRDSGHAIAKPHKDAVDKMYELYLRIGATNELPSDADSTQAYLEDFWRILYLQNNMVPGDIPFDVIIEQFCSKMVRGEVNRKGNNQAAICKAFNEWITTMEARNQLYQIRDRKYPNDKPKQLNEGAGFASTQEEADMNRLIKGKKVHEFPDEVILDQYQKVTGVIFAGEDGKEMLEGFNVSAYTHEIITEAQERGLV